MGHKLQGNNSVAMSCFPGLIYTHLSAELMQQRATQVKPIAQRYKTAKGDGRKSALSQNQNLHRLVDGQLLGGSSPQRPAQTANA